MNSVFDPLRLAAHRILIVAPHPDDESLGCGGLASILVARGRQFHTLFVTDGGASHRNSASWPRPRLVSEREKEAARALEILGLQAMPRTFLRLNDAAMPNPLSDEWRVARDWVAGIVTDFVPELILLPWRRDPHCDHRASWQLLTEAIVRTPILPVRFEYAIWLDELGTQDDRPQPDEMVRYDFDVSRGLAVKRQAVAAHATQTSDLIDDDPDGFRLDETTISRLTGPLETYWLDAKDDQRTTKST